MVLSGLVIKMLCQVFSVYLFESPPAGPFLCFNLVLAGPARTGFEKTICVRAFVLSSHLVWTPVHNFPDVFEHINRDHTGRSTLRF